MPDLRERLLYPRAGWLSLGLLVIMGLALTWAVQGAHWLDQLEFLPPVAFWAIITGALLGVLPLRVVFTLPLSAIIGAGVVLWTIGGEYHAALSQVARAGALRDDVIGWTITVLTTGYPAQMSPYAIGLGVLTWATAFMASYAVYRHNRVIDAILLLGAAMIVNLSATFTDLFGHLLLFVIAALLLWLRAALVNRQDGWQRRRVNENLEVPAAIMRSGILFAGASVVLAWVLTSVAVAAPLTSAWGSFDGVWTGVRDQFEGVFGTLTNPQSRITGGTFGSGFTVQGEWVSNDQEALTVAAPRPLYLRTATYDVYNGRGWERSEGPTRQVAPGDPLFTGADARAPERGLRGRDDHDQHAPDARTQPVHGRIPDRGLRADRDSRVRRAAGAGRHRGGEPDRHRRGVSARGRAQHCDGGAARGGRNRLSAGACSDLYFDDSRATDRVRQLAQEVVDAAGAQNPYDQAKALAAYLQGDDSFTYATDGRTSRRAARTWSTSSCSIR